MSFSIGRKNKIFVFFSTNQPLSTLNLDQEILLNNQSVLYLFIRQQVSERHTVASDTPSNSTRFRLIEPIKVKDAFDQWDYDHLHGRFDLDLEPHTRNTSFPTRWCLSDNVSIYCRIQQAHSNGNTTSLSNFDQSTTTSTKKFLRNTRSQENNNRSNSTCLNTSYDENMFGHEDLIDDNRQQSRQRIDDRNKDLSLLMEGLLIKICLISD